MSKPVGIVIGSFVTVALAAALIVWITQLRVPDPHGYFQDPISPSPEVTELLTPPEAVEKRWDRQQAAATGLGMTQEKQILFGDTHVHTTYSTDAFFMSLPLLQGSRGAFPPADACDYARYVSQLDFYFLTDHAEDFAPEHWRDQVESVRLCNEVVANPADPDLAAFIGWEWTQKGSTPATHYGHHNVLFRDTDPDRIPVRPIGAIRPGGYAERERKPLPGILKRLDSGNASYYEGFNRFAREIGETPICKEGVNTRELPEGCYEAVATPGELYAKLDEWGFDTIVIPHGTTWGFYTPPGSSWDNQLTAEHHDPDKGRLIELYSGHGNSENHRTWRARLLDERGEPICPEPSAEYLPGCWQAGEIIRERCLAVGEDAEECERRTAEARQNYLEAPGGTGWLTVPGASPEDWLDAGQARDVFLPAFNYRPGKSVQYGLALRNFDDPDEPLENTWGFIGSSDNHTARAGTGFKEYDREQATEATGPYNALWARLYLGKPEEAVPRSVSVKQAPQVDLGQEYERVTSFFTLGGLAAVHAEGRSREAIWEAMKRKEVYATSGPRILLWFDLLGPGRTAPMGTEVEMAAAPRFSARAVGAFKQLPGCPDYVREALSERRLQKLASGECYHPSDERHLIERIEVVRIRPQIHAGEAIASLIDDPWQVLPCDADPVGCTVEFSDPDFPLGGRDALYYVRAIQEATPTVNGAGLRTTFDEEGNAVAVESCLAGYRTDLTDECLADVEHRAWSSPIFVDFVEAEDPPLEAPPNAEEGR